MRLSLHALDNKSEFVDFGGQILKEVKGVARVNLLLGANNSRKSRFMRAVMQQSSIYFRKSDLEYLDVGDIENRIQLINNHCKNLPGLGSGFTVRLSSSKLAGSWNNHDKEILIRFEKIVKNPNFLEEVGNFRPQNLNGVLENIKEFYKAPNLIKTDKVEFLKKVANALIVFGRQNLLEEELRRHVQLHGPRLVSNPHVEKTWDELLSACEALGVIIEGTLENFCGFGGRRTYIPVLRGANSLLGAVRNDDIYEKSVRANYGLNPGDYLQVYSGMKLYETILRLTRSKGDERRQLSEFCRFLSHAFFASESVEIIPFRDETSGAEHISVAIGNDRECNLHDLGDGIQALILLLFPVFTAQPNSYLFIEEPETNLHPGYQRVFLETLLHNEFVQSKQITFFITTHSNHLVNITPSKGEISYFLFKWIDKECSMITNTSGANAELLSSLGVSNSSVLMAKCSIWVEGLTDRAYIASYLKAYFELNSTEKLLLEDLDYSFVEYGGSSIMHYEFQEETEDMNSEDALINALSISNRIILLSDLDGTSKERKHKKFTSKQHVNFLYLTTQGYEIENMLSEHLLEDGIKAITKSDNIELKNIFESYTEYSSILDSRPLGEYLKSGNKKKFSKYFETNGTLKTYYKKKMAKEITKSMKWEYMSDSARTLVTTIIDFVRKSN